MSTKKRQDTKISLVRILLARGGVKRNIPKRCYLFLYVDS